MYWAYKLNVFLKADVNLKHNSSPYWFLLIEALLNWAKQNNNNLFGPEPPKHDFYTGIVEPFSQPDSSTQYEKQMRVSIHNCKYELLSEFSWCH